jgi:putative redox protein
MAYVIVTNEHQHIQQIVAGQHHLTGDATVSAGGSDAGLAPRELLLGSLGGCTAIALRTHAERHNWDLGKITVGLRWSRDDLGHDHIERRLSFTQPLTAEQMRRLLTVAAETLITSLLRPAVQIHSAIVAPAPAEQRSYARSR